MPVTLSALHFAGWEEKRVEWTAGPHRVFKQISTHTLGSGTGTKYFQKLDDIDDYDVKLDDDIDSALVYEGDDYVTGNLIGQEVLSDVQCGTSDASSTIFKQPKSRAKRGTFPRVSFPSGLHGKESDKIAISETESEMCTKQYFECSYCGDKFTSRNGCSIHVKRHKRQYRAFCDICNKGFMNKTDHQGHMNSHYNRKPYECEICLKSFSYRQSYVSHKQSHNFK